MRRWKHHCAAYRRTIRIWMPSRILCNGVLRECSKLSPDLVFGLFCCVPLHKIRYGVRICTRCMPSKPKLPLTKHSKHMTTCSGIARCAMWEPRIISSGDWLRHYGAQMFITSCASTRWSPHDHLVHREEFERDLKIICEQHQLGVTPYSPLANGFLTENTGR
jgi:hypothetical protein